MLEKETIAVTVPSGRRNLQLPDDVVKALVSLPLDERRAYCVALLKLGWTLQSIATPLRLTREAIRVYGVKEIKEEAQKKVSSLPLPSVPNTKEVMVTRVKRTKIDPDVLAQLKELHAKASLVRGKSPKYREEAERFTELAWQQVQQGVSVYSISKALGLSTGALQFRFVRYGYKTSEGKSGAYNKIKNRSNNA